MSTRVTRIYIVMGTTGEYESRTEWPVRAFTDQTLAHHHITLATGRARELEEWRDEDDDPWRYADVLTRPKNEHDTRMEMQLTGTRYFLVETDLQETVAS